MTEVLEWKAIAETTDNYSKGTTITEYRDLTLIIEAIIMPKRMNAEIKCYIGKKRSNERILDLIYYYQKDKTQYQEELFEWLRKMVDLKTKELEKIARREDLL